jgi:uncharacterized protein involved in exopolysaccharide biosynthesis
MDIEEKKSSDGLPASVTSGHNGEVDPMALVRKYILPFWKLYFVAGFIGAVVLTAISYMCQPQYKTSARLLVNVNSSQSLMRSKLGGLASVAGMNYSADDASFIFNMNYISSRELADAFIDKYNLRYELFRNDYDEKGVYEQAGNLDGLYRKLLGDDYKTGIDDDVETVPGPSKAATFKKFYSVFSIDVDERKMSVVVSVRWTNAGKAKQWANNYVQLANDYLRQRAITESNARIKFLESRLNDNPPLEVQRSISSLIEDELKKDTVAESTKQYAFKVVERAYLPERKVFPRRSRFLLGGGFVGVLGMFGYIYFRRVQRG